MPTRLVLAWSKENDNLFQGIKGAPTPDGSTSQWEPDLERAFKWQDTEKHHNEISHLIPFLMSRRSCAPVIRVIQLSEKGQWEYTAAKEQAPPTPEEPQAPPQGEAMATAIKSPEEQLKANRKRIFQPIKQCLEKIETFSSMKELYEGLKSLEIQARHFDYNSSTDNLIARIIKKYINVLLRDEEPEIVPCEVMVYNDVILVTDKNGDSYRYDDSDFKFGDNAKKLIEQFEERDSPAWFYEADE